MKKVNGKNEGIIGIWGTYVAVIIIALLLNITSSATDYSNILITLGFMLIVGIILFNCTKRFTRLKKVADELNNASQKIYDDILAGRNDMSVQSVDIEFSDTLLKEKYLEFVNNYNRLHQKNPLGYKGNIEEFINYSIVDSIVRRNVVNQVSGAMTGLGILGTFIGLSMGLQSFGLNGDTEQIKTSIDSLMGGIKVAFHTSIYGMILSLSFNYFYKQQIEEGNNALERFVDTYRKYVYSDKTDDSINEFMQVQKRQADCLEKFSEGFSDDIRDALAPQFTKMNEVMENYTEEVSKKQIDGVDMMVNNFIDSLNSSMGQNFSELGNYIAQSTELQRESVDKLQTAMDASSAIVSNIEEINKYSEKTVTELEGYISGIEELQSVINNNLTIVNAQIETLHLENEKREEYIENIAGLEKNVIETEERLIDSINGSMKEMTDIMTDSIKDYKQSMSEASDSSAQALISMGEGVANSIARASNDLKHSADSVNDGMIKASNDLKSATENLNEEMARSVGNTFKQFDDNLSKIYSGLSGTILEIKTSTDRVPKVVNGSYEKMIGSMNRLEGVVKSFSEYDRNKKNNN